MLIFLIVVGLIGATLMNKRAWNYYNFNHADKQLTFSEYLSDASSIVTKIKSGMPLFVFKPASTPELLKLRNTINIQTIAIYLILILAFCIRYFLM
ncbi:MAG: hypothetical protein KBE91_09690 [Bacteroidia bacterium]|nr:hypothetical protein [Bacteroidia bacterium]MBP9689871.1 hypothetical protein [Bacteroidia bacterium]